MAWHWMALLLIRYPALFFLPIFSPPQCCAMAELAALLTRLPDTVLEQFCNKPMWLKKFYNIGKGRDTGVTEVNEKSLAQDLVRLKHLTLFRTGFLDLASEKNFAELAELCSGDDILNDAYLVKPLRSSSVVRKFTGTSGETSESNRMAFTMTSFTHYILKNTACTLYLQGTMNGAPEGVVGDCLQVHICDRTRETPRCVSVAVYIKLEVASALLGYPADSSHPSRSVRIEGVGLSFERKRWMT
ncbi:hypothetical protein C8J57DRAFT_1241079 [Mycena rebaudengoi]|nr:hypothetical protein C8J57DRAFT_1241079 [Mycena rebaudengoi]